MVQTGASLLGRNDSSAARLALGARRGIVPRETAAFMADSQVPWGVAALTGTVSEPAWRNKPSWYLVASDDRMIPPDAQRAMSKRAGSVVVEVEGSHAVYVSQPQAVASLVAKATKGVGVLAAR